MCRKGQVTCDMAHEAPGAVRGRRRSAAGRRRPPGTRPRTPVEVWGRQARVTASARAYEPPPRPRSGGAILVAVLALALAFASLTAASGGLPRTAERPPSTPIVGGEEVPLYEWTSVVAILSRDPEQATTANLCSGTLVGPRVVLTAAHCLDEMAPTEDMVVIFGDSIYTFEETRRAGVERYGLHPEACTDKCKGDAFDFGYVILAQDAYGIEIIPPLVDQAEWDEVMHVGAPVHVVGFGTVRDTDEDDAILTTDDVGHKRVMSTPIDSFSRSGNEFRAGGEGEDACGGDSGGPAFIQLESGEWRLVGVTSRGVRPCGTGDSVYGVPYPVLTWLRDETGLDLLPADCPDGTCLDMKPEVDGCGCAGGSPGRLGLLAPLLALLRRRRR